MNTTQARASQFEGSWSATCRDLQEARSEAQEAREAVGKLQECVARLQGENDELGAVKAKLEESNSEVCALSRVPAQGARN